MSTLLSPPSALTEVIRLATQRFLPAQEADYFVPTRAQVADSPLGPVARSEAGPIWVDPIPFLSGRRSLDYQMALTPPPAAPNSLTLITAQYGMGKSELMRQLCSSLHRSTVPGGPVPLPINLANCRPIARRLDQSPASGREFLEMLLSHLGSDISVAVGQDEVAEIPSLLLILDGLDELVFSRTQHDHFFHGIGLLLRDRVFGSGAQVRIAVTVRYEHLMAFESGADIRMQLKEVAGLNARLQILRLDFFTSDDLRNYYERRIGNPLPEAIADHHKLMELLQRPLLLRIFCDYVLKVGDEVFVDLGKYATPDQLLWRYLEATNSDSALAFANRQISGARYRLNLEALANVCLERFKSYRDTLTADQVRDCLRPNVPAAPVEVPEEELWPSIHKCAFLRRQDAVAVNTDADPNEAEVSFAHRSFYELLVARAMHRRIQDDDGLTEFDDFVLNVDMRKFLHAMLKEGGWYERTLQSYGLNRPEEWALLHPSHVVPDAATVAKLNHERKILLELMTNPEGGGGDESEPGAQLCAVRAFLAAEAYPTAGTPPPVPWPHEYHHPRYLLYNYEAVAVFLKYQWWDEHAAEINTGLETSLREGVKRVLERIVERDEKLAVLHGPYELLLERMFDIGLRRRYCWTKDQLVLAMGKITREELRERMRAICSELSRG